MDTRACDAHVARILFTCGSVWAVASSLAASCQAQRVSGERERMMTIHYEQSHELFPNPERGFYGTYQPTGGGLPGQQDTPHPPLATEQLKALRSSAEGVALVRDCILIPRRFWTEPISQGYLDELERNFDAVRQAGLKVIPRILYDWGMQNRDPDEDVICSHIEQLAPLIQRNADVIAWVQAGFYGGTGEACRSDHGYVYDDPASGGWQRLSEAGKRIYEKWLSAIPPDRMMAIRYPRLKWDMLGEHATVPEPVTLTGAFDGSVRARIGYYSDGFMGDEHHYAMYRLPDELEYTMADTDFVIQEGEISDATEWKLQPGRVVSEMERLHQTALNRSGDGWRQVAEVWRRNGDYEVIAARMGYRFRLVSARMPRSVAARETLSVSLTMANDGFARIMNARAVELILRHAETGAIHVITVDAPRGNRLWFPGPGESVTSTIGQALPADLPPGDHEVLLNLPDPYPSLHGRPEYSVRLANEDVWEAETGYNRLHHTLRITREDAIDGEG